MIEYPIYIASVSQVRDDWKLHVDPPKKQSNWKDETFEAKLPELWAAKELKAQDDLAASYVTEVAIKLPEAPAHVVTPAVAVDLINTWVKDTPDNSAGIIGINPLVQLRAIGWSLLMQNSEELITPKWLWTPEQNEPAVKVINLRSSAGKESTADSQAIETWLGNWGLTMLWGSGSVQDRLNATLRIAKSMGWKA